MDRKKMIELSCGIALAVTVLFNVFAEPHATVGKWWGVVFSPLCTSAVTEETDENGYVFRLKTLEWLEKWFEFK